MRINYMNEPVKSNIFIEHNEQNRLKHKIEWKSLIK